jgi:quercetin dioxygenase-like cupin family protein
MRITTRKPIALAGISLVALGTATALATAPSGETTTPLGRGALVKPANVNVKVAGGHVKLQTKGAIDALLVGITLAPGGTGGWHKHAGPLITVVKQGTLTIVDAKCQRHDVAAGQAVISPGSTTGNDENRGSTPVVFDVTFLLPHGAALPRIDQPAPTGCSA